MTVDGVHGDEIGGIGAVSEEFHTHARGQVDHSRNSDDWFGNGEAHIASVSTLEDSCVGVASQIMPDCLSNGALSMDSFVAAAAPVAGKLVTWRVKDWVLVDD